MSQISKEKRDAITTQIKTEIDFARRHKQSRIANWKANEDMYYGKKPTSEESVANVDLGLMTSFVHTILSKIDSPLTFKFKKSKESQMKRVQQLNALKEQDQDNNDWDIKDLAGKKQAIIYGRAVFSYFAESVDGYSSNLGNVDAYDFLIDPTAGGIDIEIGRYMGDYNVILDSKQLKEGIKAGIYFKQETEDLIASGGNATETTQETINKGGRATDNGTYQVKQIEAKDVFKFWNWCTTYEGVRYYALYCERGHAAIELCELEEKFESKLWPYWTWAAQIDLTEFWTPSYCDMVREVFMAQAVSINQMLDNADKINKPMRVVDVGAFEDLGQLVPRRNGVVEVKEGIDVNKAYQVIATPSINTPITVYELLDKIGEKASGVTAGVKGVAEEDGRVAIYEGNQESAADKFGLLNRTYSFGYKRFAKLWEHGVRENLIKKQSVEILGPNGIEIMDINRNTIFRKNKADKFKIMIEASNAEVLLSKTEQVAKLEFLKENMQSTIQNQRKAYEIGARAAGFDEDQIKELTDVSDYGEAGLLSEAMRDIEMLIDGETVQPNQAATTAYAQKFIDYMRDNQEKLSKKEFANLQAYYMKLKPIITQNMVKRANDTLFKQQMEALSTPMVQANPEAGPMIPGNGG